MEISADSGPLTALLPLWLARGALTCGFCAGETWHPAEGRESWRWALPAAADEPRDEGLLLSRAVDDCGVVEPVLDMRET